MSSWTRVAWFWGKVLACLVLLDVLLFRTGIFWDAQHLLGGRMGQVLGQAFFIVREIEIEPSDGDEVIITGSSVVGGGVRLLMLRRLLAERNIPSKPVRLGSDAASSREVALMANATRRMHPWLLIYGVAARDLQNWSIDKSVIADVLGDPDLPFAVPPDLSLGDRFQMRLKQHWLLLRYRRFVRSVLDQLLWDTPTAQAADRRPPRPSDLQRFDPEFFQDDDYDRWRRWRDSRRFSDYVRYLQQRKMTKLYTEQAAEFARIDLNDSPQADAIRWLARTLPPEGTQVMLVFFPENPLFRLPAAAPYFNAEFSDRLAAFLADQAREPGVTFLDLRDLLIPEDFYDMIHPNVAGEVKITQRIAEVIAEQWRERPSS